MTIDATDLIGIRLSADGKRLRIRDQNGQTVSFSLPASWLNAMLSAIAGLSDTAGTVHPLGSWSMDRAGPGQADLVLTLRTPEGQAVSFLMKPWQVEGMATIATYGSSGRTSGETMH
jgi:hypothetical protein